MLKIRIFAKTFSKIALSFSDLNSILEEMLEVSNLTVSGFISLHSAWSWASFMQIRCPLMMPVWVNIIHFSNYWAELLSVLRANIQHSWRRLIWQLIFKGNIMPIIWRQHYQARRQEWPPQDKISQEEKIWSFRTSMNKQTEVTTFLDSPVRTTGLLIN